MKKSFLLLLCLALFCPLFACASNATEASTDATEATQSESSTQGESDALEADLADTTNSTDTDEQDTTATGAADAETQTNNILSIACSTKGYNPYLTTDTLVAQSASLLFENFIDISPDFEIDYRIAQDVVSSGYTVTITLRSGCFFADATPITTEDLLASFTAAQNSETYSARFSNVLSASITDTQLILTLASPDSLFEYLLDIPILKADDVASTTPTASGRYTYSADGTALFTNIFAPFPTDDISEIQLVTVASYDEMMSAFALGYTNYAVQGESLSTQGSSIASSEHYYKTNIMLYLGVNSYVDNPLCNTAAGRSLLSELIARDDLVLNTYDTRAYAARGALNSFYPAATNAQSILSTADSTNLEPTMTALGYTYDDESGFYLDATGATASVSILLHTTNSYKLLIANELAEEWAKYGIETTLVTTADFNSFLTMLESNEFELYIGEVKLYNNIELSSFLWGTTSYGIQMSDALLVAYYTFREDASTAAAFETTFTAEMPYIPLLWRNGVVLTNRDTSGVSASISNPFYSLEDLTFSN